MVGINQRMPSRGPSRIAYPRLRLRSFNLTEPPQSQVRAQGIASSDWRKKTTNTSSESTSARSLQTSSEARSRKEGNGSSSEMPPYCMEKEDMPDRAIRYRPKSDQAAWELVVSAPAGRAPGSPSSTSSQGHDGMMRVMFKDMKPMTMNFGDEEIVLSNSFTFDLVPEPLPSSSSGGSETRGTVGVLKPVRNLRERQRLSSSTESVWDYLPGDLHSMLENSRLLALNSAGGFKGQGAEAADEDRKGKKRAQDRSSDSGYGGEDASSRHTGTQVDESEKRFFDMLDRLHRPDPALQRCDKPRPDVDTENGTGETSQDRGAEASSQPKVHFSNTAIHHQGAWGRRAAQESSSGDSGYQSGGSVRVRHELPDIPPSTMEGSKAPPSSPQEKHDDEGEAHQSIPKRLNPAAAEFKARTAPVEFAQPQVPSRKPARMPLPNFVPGGTQDSTSGVFPQLPPPVPSHAPGTLQSQQSPNFGYTSIPPGFEGTFSKPLGLPDARATHLGDATTVNPFDQRLPATTRLTGAPLAPTNAGLYLPNFGLPSLPLLQVQASMGQLNTDAFNIFSHMNLSALGSVPNLVLNLRGPMPAAPMPPLAPQPPILGLDPKVHRPTFPVTQKPRDRDPIKQQLYEQYLEWRKANEPGYHQACKIRQAQRVVRQYIQKHHAEKTEDEETKTVVEKTVVENAKAMIRAAAAEAAAEKQRKIDEVREGFKAKVMERTKGLVLGENTKPECVQGEMGVEAGA